tara:strand:+ start:907 stop:1524 length:618 start_codon:yes stop_codon:yes gene_type:complete
MDGTIVDSLPYHHEAWKIFFNENQVENFSDKLKDYKGGGTLDLMKAVYGNKYSLKDLKSMSDEKEVIFREIYKGKINPIEGFKKFLIDIKSKHILVGLASNAVRKNVSLIINELNIFNDFDSIICGDEVNNGKPNPEMFNKTINRFNIKKDECLIFEDSLEGVKAANNSGIKVVGISSSTSDKTLIDAGSIKTISNYIGFDLSKI